MKPGETKRAQLALTRLGYDVGKADDDLGKKTLAGIMALAAGRRVTDQLVGHAEHLLFFMERYGIVGQYRMAHFIANLSHESQGFTRLRENLVYTDAQRLRDVFPKTVKTIDIATRLVRGGKVVIGNYVYAGKNGNGNEASGDGYLYLGRGWMGHTGRDNYAHLSGRIGIDLVKNPQAVERSDIAAHAACLYWDDNRLNLPADKDDARSIRVAINGEAARGLSECRKAASKILALFHP